jgi:hypothetical protein
MSSNVFFSKEKEEEHKTTSTDRLLVTPGIWVDGRIYWMRNGNERLIMEKGISICLKETVHSKIRTLEVFVRNHQHDPCQIKVLFVHHYSNPLQDHFAFISPAENVIFHIVNNNIFLVNGLCSNQPLEQMTIHPYWSVHTDQIWSSLEKGILKYQPMAKGMTVSISAATMTISPESFQKGNCWIIEGRNKEELLRLNRTLLKTD